MPRPDAPSPGDPAARGGAPATRFPTRVLLTAAAIGAAGAVYISAISWASVFTGAIAYYLYAATFALWTLPVMVAQGLLARPGIAPLTSVLMALISAPLIGASAYHLVIFVLVGVLFELPFLVTRYRRWGSRMLWVAHSLSAFVSTALYAVTVFLAYDVPVWWLFIGVIAVGVLTSIGTAGIARVICTRLQAAGVARGSSPRAKTTKR